ncbi:MAG: NTP transferase domain-containing protein [Candidatus Obscuribacter sp.]|nr:NTP transferase domain-containing protein [Candidatus Obscuribacter sp.]
MASVRAIILAAGQGKRMKSARPKMLHEVMGKAIITRVIDQAQACGVEHVHLVVGHQADIVKEFVAQNTPAVSYSCHLQ